MPPSPSVPGALRSDAGLVFLIGSNPDRPGELSWPALAALGAADAVVHDGNIGPDILALVPRQCFVEAIPADIARVRKLASEGWRVVWLVAGDPATLLGKLTEAERLAEAGIAMHAMTNLRSVGADTSPAIGSGGVRLAPQPFATPLNGLAG